MLEVLHRLGLEDARSGGLAAQQVHDEQVQDLQTGVLVGRQLQLLHLFASLRLCEGHLLADQLQCAGFIRQEGDETGCAMLERSRWHQAPLGVEHHDFVLLQQAALAGDLVGQPHHSDLHIHRRVRSSGAGVFGILYGLQCLGCG